MDFVMRCISIYPKIQPSAYKISVIFFPTQIKVIQGYQNHDILRWATLFSLQIIPSKHHKQTLVSMILSTC
jgi:hypothetical protein